MIEQEQKNNNNNNQISQNLSNLINEYLVHFLKVRELYFRIENKAITEEGFTEDSIDTLLYEKFKEAIKINSCTNNNTDTIDTNTNTSTKTNNKDKDNFPLHFQHFQ
jgi:hypothetical protein